MRGVDGLQEGLRPADVALPRVLGGGQGSQSTNALQATLEGKATERNVVVALLAIYVGGKSIVAPSRRKPRLGRCHPGSGVSPFALTLAPGRRMPFSGEPFLKDGAADGSPEPVDHGEQADGPLGQRSVVILLGEQGATLR